MERRGLGKGLSALFTQAGVNENIVKEIPVHQIHENPYQPRRMFDEDTLKELADSIRQVGVLQPVIVRQIGLEEFELIAGERRLRASYLADLDTIPAIIREPTQQQMLEMALIENLQRQDINAVDAAIAYKRLMDEFDLTQEEVAVRVGKSQPAIANTLRLLNLPEYILQSVETGLISEGHARALLRISDPVEQRSLWVRISSEGLSVRATEHAIRNMQTPQRNPNQAVVSYPIPVAPPPEVRALEHNLGAFFGTKVTIVYGDGGKGRLVIEFYSEEDLGRVLDLIVPNGF
jgi:ParB family chromosome partitioning protein